MKLKTNIQKKPSTYRLSYQKIFLMKKWHETGIYQTWIKRRSIVIGKNLGHLLLRKYVSSGFSSGNVLIKKIVEMRLTSQEKG